MSMVETEHIAEAVRKYSPRLVTGDDRGRAAVALMLRDLRQGPEVLFIERARRSGDPWS